MVSPGFATVHQAYISGCTGALKSRGGPSQLEGPARAWNPLWQVASLGQILDPSLVSARLLPSPAVPLVHVSATVADRWLGRLRRGAP